MTKVEDKSGLHSHFTALRGSYTNGYNGWIGDTINSIASIKALSTIENLALPGFHDQNFLIPTILFGVFHLPIEKFYHAIT